MRNRIISGMSDALVVTEAALKSGTVLQQSMHWNTEKMYLLSLGLLLQSYQKARINLLEEGAIPVWNGYQILEELQMFSN